MTLRPHSRTTQKHTSQANQPPIIDEQITPPALLPACRAKTTHINSISHSFITILFLLFISSTCGLSTAASASTAPVGLSTKPESANIDPALDPGRINADRSHSVDPDFSVRATPGKVTVFMHEAYKAGQPVVIMKIPYEYLGAKTEHVINNIGFSFSAYFPTMRGPFSSKYSGPPTCLGYCQGEIIAEVDNRSGSTIDNNAIPKWDDVTEQVPIDTLGIFDKAEVGIKHHNLSIRYYFKYAKNHNTETFVRCNESAVSPYCEEWMRLPAHSQVQVHYTFSMTLLSRWREIHGSVGALVDSFITSPPP